MAGESAGESARRMRAKADRLIRSAELHERGAEGERATAAVLAMLPAEWTVLHDIPWPGRRFANVDHVVVGPPGVFVIDSKNWSGSVAVQAGVLRQNGRLREPTVSAAAEAARAVARQIPELSPSHVHPVLCFVRKERITGRVRGVMACSTGNLLDLLLTRPPVLTEQMRQRAMRELTQRKAVEFERAAATRPLRTMTPSSPRRRRQPSKGVGRMLGRFTGFVATVSVLFAMLTTDLPDRIAQVFVSVMTPDDSKRAPSTDENDKKRKRSPDKPQRRERERSDPG